MTRRYFYHADESAEYWFDEGCHILELANSADEPDISIARARVGAGQATRWHSLNATTERYVILSGGGIVEIGEESKERVTAGAVVCIPPGTRQRISSFGEEDLVFLAICSPRFTSACYVPME